MAASFSSDIVIPSSIPELELFKHTEFLSKYGTSKEDYVSRLYDMLE